MSKTKDDKPIPKIKIVSLGESRVGKSCLIKRFCEGNRFVSQYIPTIGIDYGARQFTDEGTVFFAHFWDMSGDDSYFEVRNEFYGDTNGFLIVYDQSNRESFNQLNRWVEEARRYGADLSVAVLCANKCDITKVEVPHDEGAAFAKKLGIPFFETSAKSGKNVPDAFTQLFRLVLARLKSQR